MERFVALIARTAAPLLVVAVLVCTAISPFAQQGGDPLAAGFKNPPDSARPRTWWHWTMSNVTTNRIVFHTSAHQPLDTRPGNTMVGTHVHRNITWAGQAAPFMTYLARASYMLQQGLFVADLAYLLNEGAPSTPPIWGPGTMPPPPEGHDYDFVNADVLLNRTSVTDDGRIALPDGMSYRVLVLPDTDRVRPELLRKIRELVTGGAIVVGRKPERSPSLANYPAADEEVLALAAEIWGDLDGAGRSIRRVGKGAVYWGWPLARVLQMEKIEKDFDYAQPLDSDVAWLHRRVKADSGDTDVYYVANLTDRPQAFDARFRVAGRQVELWHPDTGAIEPGGYTIAGAQTTVPLQLAERESVFVVFRRPAAAPRDDTREDFTTLATIEGEWDVAFPGKLGAPPQVRLERLESWTVNADDGVKYFSGTATYRKTIKASGDWFTPDRAVVIDLGRVGDIAEVSVNGRALGQLWKAPYRVDVSAALRPGENHLEIKVTNQWTNRIAGDRLLPADRKVLPPAASERRGPGGQAPLPESGLLGPVTIRSQPLNRVADGPDASVAGIPANYTEARTGRYRLPDPLKLADGRPVRDAQAWLKRRRPELVRLFEENQYGRAPGRPADMRFEVFDKGTPAFDGRATRRQVTIYFTKDNAGPKLDLLIYLPTAAMKPVPLLLNIGFTANNLTVDDSGVKVGAIWNAKEKRRMPATGGRRFGSLNVAATIERGFGIATFNYADVDPDASGAVAHGIRGAYVKRGQSEPAPDEWGSIAAWAWGISRVVDYLETDRAVDATRIAITGVSRLGKTVMWAGAADPRIAAVIASCSGEGGAALSRRNYGETIAHLVAPTRYPYQFARNYATWAADPNSSPIDANLLVALIAPRALLLQTGDTDYWSDPKGEFLAAIAAKPVYELFGRHGPATDAFPPPGQIVGDTLAYYMHAGGHGMVPGDWAVYLDFLEKQLQGTRPVR